MTRDSQNTSARTSVEQRTKKQNDNRASFTSALGIHRDTPACQLDGVGGYVSGGSTAALDTLAHTSHDTHDAKEYDD